MQDAENLLRVLALSAVCALGLVLCVTVVTSQDARASVVRSARDLAEFVAHRRDRPWK
jgi:uncharacterized membrane protein